MPRFNMSREQGQPPHAPLQTPSSSSGPSPPPSKGAKVKTGRSASKVPIPEQFDLTVDDTMDDAHDGAAKALAEREQAILEKK